MVQIRQTPKVEEGNSGFLGDIGKIAGAAAPVVSIFNPLVGAGLAAASGLNSLSAKQGSVEQQPGVQASNGGALQRRLQEMQGPAQLPPMAQAQAPQSPEFEALRRRLTLG